MSMLRPAIFQSEDWLVCATALTGDSPPEETRLENARRVAREAGVGDAAVAVARQVHGSRVVTVLSGGGAAAGEDAHDRLIASPPGAGFEACEADALVIASPGLLAGVFTADCVPLVVADPVRRIAAVVHAGREGTHREIARRVVARMASLGSRPGDLLAWIGPSICADHYEVSEEMAMPFRRAFGRWLGAVGGAQGRHLDLARTNRMQLIETGLDPQRIAQDERCTFEDQALCSYRRDGADAGRMFTFACARATCSQGL